MNEFYTTYIKNLALSDSFKNSIIDEKFAKNNPSYYQNYPLLFSKAFLIAEKDLELLNVAGYLYYQATIFTDALIDEQDISKFALISVCQEESIKILTSIFGLKHRFWTLWNSRKKEYLEAVYLEKTFLKKNSISIEDYEILADKKSAFGKVAIDCLYSIDETNATLYHQLLLSHKYFSVAFQLNDDIQDLKADIKKGQFNWAHYLLKQEKLENETAEALEKYLYIRGIAKKMYQLGIFYCEKAALLVENYNAPEWKNVLLDTKKSFLIAVKEIDDYLEILSSDIHLKKEKFQNIDLENSIITAIRFIKQKQLPNGSWREYVNQGGVSNIWATAFITTKISENEVLKDYFKNEISNAIAFLSNNGCDNLWGYNTTWIADADSTNFTLLAFVLNNKEINNQVIKNWLSFQNSEGGFATYCNKEQLLLALDDKLINDVTGWLNSHNCVSAVSFYFLARYNQSTTAFIKIKDYFNLNSAVKEDAYWWTNQIYTLHYLSKTYALLKQEDKVIAIIDKIKKLQHQDGSFSDKYGANIFYTALALEILLLDAKQTVVEVEKAIIYLLQQQYEDGSWDNSFALQVPYASAVIPENIDYPISSFGMNVRAKEFNRLFTTSSVLQAITTYESKYNTTIIR